MSGIFTMVQTDAGKAAARADSGSGINLTFTHIGFGTGLYDTRDGGGVPLPAITARTALVNEVQRIALTAAAPMGERQALLIATLPGGEAFDVGEIGVYLDDGTLFAVASRASAAYFTRGAGETATQFAIAWDDADAESVTITTNGDAALALIAIDVANLQAAMDTKYDKTGGTIDGDVIVNGDLFVNGELNQVSANELNVGDAVVRLVADLGEATAPSVDAGIEVNRGSQTDVSFKWLEESDIWQLTGTFRLTGDLQVNNGQAIRMFGAGTDYSSVRYSGGGVIYDADPTSQVANTFHQFKVDGYIIASIGANPANIPGAHGLAVRGGSSVSLLVGGDSGGTGLSHLATKVGRIGSPHYANDEQPVGFAFVLSTDTENRVHIGGGTSLLNSATTISFVTAADNVTTTGSIRWEVNSGGDLVSWSGSDIIKAMTNEGMYISGSDAPNKGANLYLLGNTHPTDAYDFAFRRGAVTIFHYDDDLNNGTFSAYKDFRTQAMAYLDAGSRVTVQNQQDGGSTRGIFWWEKSNTGWGSYMATAGAGKSLGAGAACASLDGRTQHHIRHRVLSTTTGGVIWENALELCLMSLTADTGVLYTLGGFHSNGKLTVNGGCKVSVQNKVDGGSGQGIFLWDTDSTNSGIYVASAGAGKSLADGVACASIDGRTGTLIRTRAVSGASFGFVWENNAEQCLMSLASDVGDLFVRRKVQAETFRATANKTITGSYTALVTDYRLFMNRAAPAPATITLPTGSEGLEFIIKDRAGDFALEPVTVQGTGGQLIDGATTFIMKRKHQANTFVFHGGAWNVV